MLFTKPGDSTQNPEPAKLNIGMWTGWKRIVTNIIVLALGLGLGMLLWFEVLGRLFFGRW